MRGDRPNTDTHSAHTPVCLSARTLAGTTRGRARGDRRSVSRVRRGAAHVDASGDELAHGDAVYVHNEQHGIADRNVRDEHAERDERVRSR